MPDIMLEIEKIHRICRRVNQSLFIETTDTFTQYINTLSPDEIDQLDDNKIKWVGSSIYCRNKKLC